MMAKMKLKRIRVEVERLVKEANFSLRKDVSFLLGKAYQKEKHSQAKRALGWIIENARIARQENLAICQDSGLAVVFIEIGKGADISSLFIETVKKAVEEGYYKNYLRASIVDPLKRKTPSYKGVVVHLEMNLQIKGLKITVFPKGFGSENKTQLKMFNPTATLQDIENFLMDSIIQAGSQSCPPFIVGIGIGGTSETALFLAKKALLKRVDKPNPDTFLNKLEKRWLKRINSLGIGPMGLGGKFTCLAVKIKTAPTHIAGLPVGINISCHALRSATLRLNC